MSAEAQHIVRVTITCDYHVWSDRPEMTDGYIADVVGEALPGDIPDANFDEGAWIGDYRVKIRRVRKRLEGG